MKHYLLLALLPLVAPAAFAADAASSTLTAPVKAELRSPQLTPGANRIEVLQKLGRPQLQVSPELWIYSGYHVENPSPAQERCTQLLVRFANGRVVRMELATPEFVTALTAPPSDSRRSLAAK